MVSKTSSRIAPAKHLWQRIRHRQAIPSMLSCPCHQHLNQETFSNSNSKSSFAFRVLSDSLLPLYRLLRSIYIDKDPAKKKDVIKKVIAYMTLGIDVSRLYPEMVKASQTSDIVTKKMVYLYLINYAQQNSELAILAINTF